MTCPGCGFWFLNSLNYDTFSKLSQEIAFMPEAESFSGEERDYAPSGEAWQVPC
jgi:hypothetical protein